MVRHNNMIPNGHFHKSFEKNIKTWFKQPMKKKSRNLTRLKKQRACAPAPLKKIRPVVRCPTARYNTRTRRGRGFTLNELKAAGLEPKFARTIGIPVDQRRKNQCLESLLANKLRLQNYLNRLVLDNNGTKEKNVKQLHGSSKIRKPVAKTVARVPTKEDKSFSAFNILRKARVDKKLLGRRLKRKQGQSETDAVLKPSRKKRYSDED